MSATTTERVWSITEAAAATGTTPDTLRYYERADVMPQIPRNAVGQRVYDSDSLGWISFVRRLRSTGMSMHRIADYTRMVREGTGTIGARRQMLAEHRDTVAGAVAELTEALAVLDRKVAHYEAAERGVDVDCSEQPLVHTPRLG